MSKKSSLIIFTDLDGSLLHRDTFKFDKIKDYINSLIDEGIIIIPNTSKTEKEIEEFIKELGSNLPFISENGSSIHGLNLINSNFPNKIVLSRDKQELIEIFDSKVPENLKAKCKFISKKDLQQDNHILGPAIIIDDFTSILVRPNWELKKVGQGDIILNKISKKKHKVENVNKSKPNPMLLEVFNNIFMSIAEQMGVVLENTAQSVTIKERLDFSCAVFDNNGDLMAIGRLSSALEKNFSSEAVVKVRLTY